jgi:hypothetical protein
MQKWLHQRDFLRFFGIQKFRGARLYGSSKFRDVKTDYVLDPK